MINFRLITWELYFRDHVPMATLRRDKLLELIEYAEQMEKKLEELEIKV